jgi:hypothetical protein
MIASRSLTDGPARARDGRAEPEAPPRPRGPHAGGAGADIKTSTDCRDSPGRTVRSSVDTGEIGVSRSAVSLTSHVPWPCASRPIAITQQAARTADSAARGAAARSARAETHSTTSHSHSAGLGG